MTCWICFWAPCLRSWWKRTEFVTKDMDFFAYERKKKSQEWCWRRNGAPDEEEHSQRQGYLVAWLNERSKFLNGESSIIRKPKYWDATVILSICFHQASNLWKLPSPLHYRWYFPRFVFLLAFFLFSSLNVYMKNGRNYWRMRITVLSVFCELSL